MMLKLNFTENPTAQDMISIVMKDKNLSEKDAVEFSINLEMYGKIVKEGYASIAFDLWGHDNPERKWKRLKNPIIEINIDAEKERLIADIAKRENVGTEMAVGYFLIFMMDSLGYHI
ncbi:MAG: hypothetical protein KH297_01050 [Firmicutes bacterium]|nr:hypothetical protein [Bacillota bacterium]